MCSMFSLTMDRCFKTKERFRSKIIDHYGDEATSPILSIYKWRQGSIVIGSLTLECLGDIGFVKYAQKKVDEMFNDDGTSVLKVSIILTGDTYELRVCCVINDVDERTSSWKCVSEDSFLYELLEPVQGRERCNSSSKISFNPFITEAAEAAVAAEKNAAEIAASAAIRAEEASLAAKALAIVKAKASVKKAKNVKILASDNPFAALLKI